MWGRHVGGYDYYISDAAGDGIPTVDITMTPQAGNQGFRACRCCWIPLSSGFMVVCAYIVCLIFGLTLTHAEMTSRQSDVATVHGVVKDNKGPVQGAIVRLQTTEVSTTTDALGRFHFDALKPDVPVSISAWAPGYYIGGGDEVIPPADNVQLTLIEHTREDHPDYQWMPSLHTNSQQGKACVDCHSSVGSDLPFTLTADEWLEDAHSQSAINPRFLSMYNGTDVQGHQSPPIRKGHNRDYGQFPLPPDMNKPYYGPGYKLDFPGSAGNCAACHVPVAAVNTPYSVDPNTVTGGKQRGKCLRFLS